jgi:hypothetical protein
MCSVFLLTAQRKAQLKAAALPTDAKFPDVSERLY